MIAIAEPFLLDGEKRRIFTAARVVCIQRRDDHREDGGIPSGEGESTNWNIPKNTCNFERLSNQACNPKIGQSLVTYPGQSRVLFRIAVGNSNFRYNFNTKNRGFRPKLDWTNYKHTILVGSIIKIKVAADHKKKKTLFTGRPLSANQNI